MAHIVIPRASGLVVMTSVTQVCITDGPGSTPGRSNFIARKKRPPEARKSLAGGSQKESKMDPEGTPEASWRPLGSPGANFERLGDPIWDP